MIGDPGEALERRRRAFALLREAFDITGGAREEWIAERCGGDAVLAAELRALLASEHAGVLDGDAGTLAARLVEEDPALDPLPPGTRLGDWTIVRALGHGGMGTVHLAERDGDGYLQRGALKLIKRGMDSAAVLARFRRERQILSRLEHPHIARLLDGGVSTDGQPYFVMEYVDGDTLRQWLLRAQPGLDARLGVFLQLGDAVAHAHHHLVVHRDIKPENVLVATDGHARLLDFGIAKLLEADGGTEQTVTQRRFVSRAYAAPEQIEGDAATTATDVYQLGALLFELLTGARFGDARPAGAISGWLARAQAADDAATRKAVPATRLRGDAAIVIARATDADPQRRYATVEALCADVRAWRSGHPIAARPDSTTYRLRRFVGRHRVASMAATLAIAAILAGSTLALWQARKAAEQERIAVERAETAERIKRFMIGLFRAPDPSSARGTMPRADELLDRGAAQAADELAGQPRLQAELYETMALSYMGLGRFATAAELLERALRGLAGTGEDALAARIEATSGAAHAELGHYDGALAALDRAMRLRATAHATNARDSAHDEIIRGWVLRDLGRYADSEAALRRSLALAQATPDDMNPAARLALNNLAYTLQLEGRKADSIAAYERLLAWLDTNASPDDPARLWAGYTFGKSLRDLGEPARARELLEHIRPAMRKVVGDAHSDLAGLDIALGQARMDLGDAGGRDLVADAVARSHRATPERNMLWAQAEFALAEAERHGGNTRAATEHYASARAAYVTLVGTDHPSVRACDHGMAALDGTNRDAGGRGD